MPTVLIIEGFVFFFYSSEGNEPPHIHVERAGAKAKWWLVPEARVAYVIGMRHVPIYRERNATYVA